jgi:hypothetical protein
MSKKSATSVPSSQPRLTADDLLYEGDTHVLARLLEGVVDRAAVAFMAHGSVLRIRYDADGAPNVLDTVARIEGDEAFGQFMEVLYSDLTHALTSDERNRVERAALHAITLRTATAYLFGLAMGRRLGPPSLAGPDETITEVIKVGHMLTKAGGVR